MSDVSFTEAEVKKLTDAVNFIYTNASFGEVTSTKAREITRSFDLIGQHVKLCESKILELKAVIEKPSDKKAK